MKHQDSIVQLIERHFEEMTELEHLIATYFLSPDTIQKDLSSQAVAKTLHVSQAALTRFAKKCGFKGYREFIFQYLEPLPAKTQKEHNAISRRVLRSYTTLLENTEHLLNEKQLKQIALMVEQAKRVYFFGIGSSGLVARELKFRFMRLGLVCEAITDPDGFAWTTSILDEDCLVMGFSLSGKTRSVLDSLLDAKGMGAKTVLFTSYLTKETQAFHETVLVSPHSQADYIQRVSAQFPLLIMSDFLYAYFLEIDRKRKEKIFNSYWENRKLNGFHKKQR